VLGAGWRPVVAGGVVWSWSFPPPPSLFRLDGVLGVLVVFSAVWRHMPLAMALTVGGHGWAGLAVPIQEVVACGGRQRSSFGDGLWFAMAAVLR
jgi:hypothetical protein